ncbi:hypothetical protein BAUCODRAFT_346232 [Baudoinia panamericana UAMH 10762]|uniref:Uncharacterized protein n=1 Tax=Baudoinia panamericana (strain UAMH 10762) TaxID=717646 RepID=M2NJT2_BAUPA|nr:uncharacterized protein BAUCODRAFT_346232 [Baudoinia panamericana UAMH 10762]EMC99679.1 hypothetical protein BAUCODRAFT_346232 [Baudoinia panamericana UAMH 10762]
MLPDLPPAPKPSRWPQCLGRSHRVLDETGNGRHDWAGALAAWHSRTPAWVLLRLATFAANGTSTQHDVASARLDTDPQDIYPRACLVACCRYFRSVLSTRIRVSRRHQDRVAPPSPHCARRT